jgi:hypothetical protein
VHLFLHFTRKAIAGGGDEEFIVMDCPLAPLMTMSLIDVAISLGGGRQDMMIEWLMLVEGEGEAFMKCLCVWFPPSMTMTRDVALRLVRGRQVMMIE